MIFGLADTDKSHDNIKKIVDLHSKNEDLSSKLLQQFEVTKKLEKEIGVKTNELDQFKKQVIESEYSFARGGGKSFAGKPDNFNLDNSSIEKKNDEADFTNVADEMLQSKVKKLETEIEEFERLHQELDAQNRTL